jgi:hypothetical protein
VPGTAGGGDDDDSRAGAPAGCRPLSSVFGASPTRRALGVLVSDFFTLNSEDLFCCFLGHQGRFLFSGKGLPVFRASLTYRASGRPGVGFLHTQTLCACYFTTNVKNILHHFDILPPK